MLAIAQRKKKQKHYAAGQKLLKGFLIYLNSIIFLSCSSSTLFICLYLTPSLFFFLMSLLLIFLCFKHIFTVFVAGRRQFARHEWAQKAAYLLGCTLEELSSAIFKHQAKGLQHSTSFRGGSDENSQGDSSGKNPNHRVVNLFCKILCTLM